MDLPSVLGGLAQGFKDFGTSVVDLFGTGGAAIGDLLQGTGTRNQDDFRKWLYNTNSVQDAAAKGLGTALNGVQTVSDYIPGIGAVTRNPLFNAAQGALGGLADEFKMNGENYDLGRAGQRAAVSGAAALAGSSLGDALKKSANPLLKSGLAQGLARGATGGAINQGGYAAIDGGDVWNSALQGAGMGALLGGATGAVQDFMPRKLTPAEMALTDSEKQARVANIDDQLSKLDTATPEGMARRTELLGYRKKYAPDTLDATLAADDMAVNSPKLTPEQEAYFKDSVIRDENGNLMPMYHGSRSKFTVFDNSKGGESNKMARVGHWFTPNEQGARRFADQTWYGDLDEPEVYSTYLNIKKPKIYEPIDNSEQINSLQNSISDLRNKLEYMRRGTDEFNETYKQYNDLSKQLANLSYGDPYEQFRSDVYAMEGKSPEQANVGGIGMIMDDERAAAQKYVQSLRDQGYDGIIIKGTGYDGGTLGGPNDQYVVFDSNQIKDINNLKPTSDVDIMASRMTPDEMDLARALAGQDMAVNSAKVAPGQLGLFDDLPTQTPKTGTRQASLFDQPDNPYLDYYGADIDATPLVPETPANPYAPVNGEITQAMRDRAGDILGNWKKNGVPENELYNAINQDTLPDKIKSLKEVVDGGAYEKRMKELFGTTDIKKADIGKVIDYIYNTEPARAENIKNNLLAERGGLDKYEQRFRNRMKKSLYEAAQERIANDVGANGLASSKNIADISIRQGYTAAADEALSERLGIAPGNTPKYNGAMDTRNAFGRYSHPSYREGGDLAVFERKMSNPEDAISTVAHERLHSFQGELEPRSKGRYDKEVLEAYEQLRRDLAPHYKSWDETAQRYGHRGTGYWQSVDEQESRMLQNYLENKGYTDSTHMKSKYRAGEWGNEINPAFDKFFDKLRDLSKRGVALPAIAGLLGGGVVLDQVLNSKDSDKDKKKTKRSA